jgi:hypothetical protein
MMMNKATISLFTGAFSIGCFALWVVVSIYGVYLRSQGHSVSELPNLTSLVLKWQLAIALVPLPFILYCAWSVFRKTVTSEGIALYVGILAFIFMVLFLVVSAAVVLPMVPFQDTIRSQ